MTQFRIIFFPRLIFYRQGVCTSLDVRVWFFGGDSITLYGDRSLPVVGSRPMAYLLPTFC